MDMCAANAVTIVGALLPPPPVSDVGSDEDMGSISDEPAPLLHLMTAQDNAKAEARPV